MELEERIKRINKMIEQHERRLVELREAKLELLKQQEGH